MIAVVTLAVTALIFLTAVAGLCLYARSIRADIPTPKPAPRPVETHKCGPWCATWTLAELRSHAPTAPHECTHNRRKVGRCARKHTP